MTWIKVCGITRPDDARVAAEAGADAIGFVFAPGSPRAVTPEQARRCAEAAGPGLLRVGVFVDAPLDVVLDTARRAGLNAVQLHGREAPEWIQTLQAAGLQVIKAFRVRDTDVLAQAAAWAAAGKPQRVLLDAYHPTAPGGTGLSWDWRLFQQARSLLGPTPLVMAGGLRPENVFIALATARPDGVDASSGLECTPGRKDPALVRDFIQRVRHFDREHPEPGPLR